MTKPQPLNQPATPSFVRTVLVGLIGNVMELYDFAVYGYFAASIGRLFFPSDQPVVSLMASFGAFAAGFLVRPLGAIVFGRIGDRLGPERAMMISIVAMAVPTVLMGILPTFHQIGILAPILLIILRMVQGLSVGGEYTSSLIFLVEHAKPGRQAFTSVWGAWGATAGTLLGSAVGFLTAISLTHDQLESWGWRIPFLFGGCVALIGITLRKGLHAPAHEAPPKVPLRALLAKHRASLIRVTLINIGFGMAFYTVFVYAVTFLEEVSQKSGSQALRNNSLAMILLLLVCPLAAKLADRCGLQKVFGFGFCLLALSAIPLFHLMGQGIRWLTLGCHLALALPVGIIMGAHAALNVQLMPREVRCTGLAFAYNLGVGVFGGITPIVVTWLTARLHSPAAPGYWVAAGAALTTITLLITAKSPPLRNGSSEPAS